MGVLWNVWLFLQVEEEPEEEPEEPAEEEEDEAEAEDKEEIVDEEEDEETVRALNVFSPMQHLRLHDAGLPMFYFFPQKSSFHYVNFVPLQAKTEKDELWSTEMKRM